MKEKNTTNICVTCIKELLKLNFPSLKYQIKSSNTIDGSSINLIWSDGPTNIEIEKIIEKHKLGEFDRLKNIYVNSNFHKNIPQVNYITCKRIMSDIAYNTMIKKYPINTLSGIIYNEFKNTTFSCGQTLKIKIDKSKVLDINDYFEKIKKKSVIKT